MHYYFRLIIPLILLSACVPLTTSTSSLTTQPISYTDMDYLSTVGISQEFPTSGSPNDFPVISTRGSGITLSFDLLEENYRNLTVEYIHCNRSWLPSNLMSVRFLRDYNEFSPSDYFLSGNTTIPYVFYEFTIPAPTISGNYLLLVKDNNTKELVLSRRAVVFDQQVTINTVLDFSNNYARKQNQTIDFSIQYDPKKNIIPMRDLFPIIIQNHIWKTNISELKPSSIQIDKGFIEYESITGENAFPAGNEFRSFDISSVEFRGLNVNSISKYEEDIHVFLLPDKPRNTLAYTEINQDQNGNFYIQNSDYNGLREQNQYVITHFELKSVQLDQPAYVFGSFNDYQLTEYNRMNYDINTASYKKSIKLKQGNYDYLYVTNEKELYNNIEGNFGATENQYEIIVYYRNPANIYDEIIGYKLISSRD